MNSQPVRFIGLLRFGSRGIPADWTPKRLWRLAVATAALSLIYGAVMGSYSGFSGDWNAQIVFSAVKMPLLLFVTFAIALPSFFVLNTIWGLRGEWPIVIRALLVTQAAVTILLVSLSPYVAFSYASTSNYQWSVFINGVMFAIASFAAQLLLRREYAALILIDRRHRWMLWSWIFLYSFVGIQMAWVLRPFIGSPNSDTRFFREDSWGNAYVVVFDLVHSLLTSAFVR